MDIGLALAILIFGALFAMLIYANIHLHRERKKLAPEQRKEFDAKLERDVFES